MADWGTWAMDVTRTAVENPSPMATTHVGTQLGSYLITRTLGRGGMGVVYAAEHLRTGGKWPSRSSPRRPRPIPRRSVAS